MKKIILCLFLFISLLGFLTQTSGQTCATQGRTVTGYANGDQSTLAVMNGSHHRPLRAIPSVEE